VIDTVEVEGFETGACWSVNLYPECGEVTVQLRAQAPRRDALSPCCARAEQEGRECTEHDDIEPDEGASRRSACNRAKVRVRRYCVSNRLNRLVTLTYAGAGCYDADQVAKDVHAFMVRLRSEMKLAPKERFPYLWVRELHPGGHGYHVHMIVGRFIHYDLIERAWGLGQTNVRKIRPQEAPGRPSSQGHRAVARSAAAYVQKYVAKSFQDEPTVPKGSHRYDCGQGFQIVASRQSVHVTLQHVWRWVAEQMDGELPTIRLSSDVWGPDYPGPPSWIGFWT
jgi:hypothetical protein